MPRIEPRLIRQLKSGQNQAVSKPLAAFVAAVFLVRALGPVSCFGWERSPEARRECCTRAHHSNCQDQAAADTCCGAQEQVRQLAPLTSAVAASLSLGQMLDVVAAVLPAVHSSQTTTTLAVLRTSFHSPPVLLVPPLRI